MLHPLPSSARQSADRTVLCSHAERAGHAGTLERDEWTRHVQAAITISKQYLLAGELRSVCLGSSGQGREGKVNVPSLPLPNRRVAPLTRVTPPLWRTHSKPPPPAQTAPARRQKSITIHLHVQRDSCPNAPRSFNNLECIVREMAIPHATGYLSTRLLRAERRRRGAGQSTEGRFAT